MASRFPVTFFKRKIHRKLPGRLPGMPSRFPVSFWLSKFWTRSSKSDFRALTGKKAASGKANIMLYIYRFLPICRYVFNRSANNAPKSMILWRFTTNAITISSTQAPSHRLSTFPTDSANGRGHQKWPKSGRPPSVGKPPKWPSGRPSKNNRFIKKSSNPDLKMA